MSSAPANHCTRRIRKNQYRDVAVTFEKS